MAVDKIRGKRLPGRSEEPSSDPADPAMAEAAAAGHPKSSTEEQKERDRFARKHVRPRRRSVEDALDQGEQRERRGDRDSGFEGEPPEEEERPLGEGNDGFESLHAAKRPILADSGAPSAKVSKAPPPVPEPPAEVLGEIAPTHADPDPEHSEPGVAGPAEVLEDLVAPAAAQAAGDAAAEVIASVTSPERNFPAPPPERPRPILPPPPAPAPSPARPREDASPLAPLPPRLLPPILPPPPRPPAPERIARVRREVRAAEPPPAATIAELPAVTQEVKALGENPVTRTEVAAPTLPELRAVDPTTTLVELPKVSLDDEEDEGEGE